MTDRSITFQRAKVTLRSTDGGETFILCHSAERKLKDQAIHERFAKKAEAGPKRIAASSASGKRKSSVIERPVRPVLGQNTRAENLFWV